jgi:regulator of RNase E activity RraA
LQGSIEDQPKVVAPASTLKLVEKTSDIPPLSESDPGAVPKGKHWVDMVDEGTVVIIEQPAGQTCAAIGGIMAARMKVRGVEACVVGGRVRDLAELRRSGLPVSCPSFGLNFQSNFSTRVGTLRPHLHLDCATHPSLLHLL